MRVIIYVTFQAMDMFDVNEMYDVPGAALGRVTCPVLVIGVDTDVHFPTWQQKELVTALKNAGSSGADLAFQ